VLEGEKGNLVSVSVASAPALEDGGTDVVSFPRVVEDVRNDVLRDGAVIHVTVPRSGGVGGALKVVRLSRISRGRAAGYAAA